MKSSISFEEPGLENPTSFMMSSQVDGPEDEEEEVTDEDSEEELVEADMADPTDEEE